MTQNHDTVKGVLDVVAVFTALGSFLEVITPVFGFIGAVVGLMRIYEMSTGKEFHTLFKRKKQDAVDK